MNFNVDQGSFSATAKRTLLRLIAAATVLIPAAVWCSDHIFVIMVPAVDAVFEWVAVDFKLLSLIQDWQGADRVVRVTVMWKHVVQVGGTVMYPDPRGTATASTLTAHAIQGPFAALLFAFVWPACKGGGVSACVEYIARALVLCPLLFALGCLDLSVMLAGELWQLVFDALAPGQRSLVIFFRDFLQMGGRTAVGLTLVALATLCGRVIAKNIVLLATVRRRYRNKREAMCVHH